MGEITLTANDVKIIQGALSRLRNPECEEGDGPCECTEIVVLSFGYAEVFEDNGEGKGECIAFGVTVWTEED